MHCVCRQSLPSPDGTGSRGRSKRKQNRRRSGNGRTKSSSKYRCIQVNSGAKVNKVKRGQVSTSALRCEEQVSTGVSRCGGQISAERSSKYMQVN